MKIDDEGDEIEGMGDKLDTIDEEFDASNDELGTEATDVDEGDGAELGCTLTLSAFIMSAAYALRQIWGTAFQCPTHLFCNCINDCLKMRGWHKWEDTSIDNSQILRTPDPQMGIHNSTLI